MKIHPYFFVLATVSFTPRAVAGEKHNLREVAAYDPSTSDAAIGASDQQSIDRPQCALHVASLNIGDVQIELPGGKVGFETFPNCKTVFSSEFLDEIGVDSSTCIMSVQQLTKASYTISRFSEFMPQEALEYLEYLKGPLTTGRAGMITCDVQTGQFSKAYSMKTWRPYKMTEGWNYFTMTACADDGWVGFGGNQGTSIDMKYEGKIGYASQKSLDGNPFSSMVSASYHVGNVGQKATKACCSPEPGVPRDCTAVQAMIDSFDVSSIM